MGGVRYERDGHVAVITYDRPEALNAIDSEMRAGLNAAAAAEGLAAARERRAPQWKGQ